MKSLIKYLLIVIISSYSFIYFSNSNDDLVQQKTSSAQSKNKSVLIASQNHSEFVLKEKVPSELVIETKNDSSQSIQVFTENIKEIEIEKFIGVQELLDNENKDITWSDKTEQKLMTLFTEEIIGIQMQSLDCRTTLCRIYLSDVADDNLNTIRRKITDTMPSLIVNAQFELFGNGSVVIYLRREL